VSGLAGDKVELVALGVEEGGPTRTVLFDLVGGSGAQREQPFGLGLEVWGDQVQVQPPPTGRGASLRAWTGSVSGVTAVDVEDMAGDE
jgi:hypothetical protein